jgi:murein DD-endopeptidase MepM/ murein hydrolase activator NlpD
VKIDKRTLFVSLGALAGLLVCLAAAIVLMTHPDLSMGSGSAALMDERLVKQPNMRYGFDLNRFEVVQGSIKRNEVLSELLSEYGISMAEIGKLNQTAADVFPTNKLLAGKDYTILLDPNTHKAQYFVYEPSALFYIVYDLTGETKAYRYDRKVDIVQKQAVGTLKTSLWDAMDELELPNLLAIKMEEALRNSSDFFRAQKGEQFKLLYTEKMVEGKSVGIGQVLAAYANFGGEDAYSFWFESEDQEVQGYYDENARPMKKAFLKAPVEFTRISSRFNLNRFHPILKRVKAHLGTDYAAPQGTPIMAIADGVVVEATRSGGNGIYVKIKHDAVYTSQYLHMCRHAQGIRPGVHVGQGQVIGYVGSTGLATGPHVCFRFWKNGQQVDFLKEKLPRPEPMTGPHVEAFFHVRDSLKQSLDAITLPPAP